MRIPAVGGVLFLASSALAGSLSLDERGLAAADAARLRAQVAETEAALPLALRLELPKKVKVRLLPALPDRALRGEIVRQAVRAYEDKAEHPLRKDSRFAHLMEFGKVGTIPFLPRRLKAKNQLDSRSPDSAEFESLVESFAVNFEYFLLDQEFACRRPAVHRFLAERFGVRIGASETACVPRTKVWLGSSDPALDQRIEADLDPARVYQVHYLFAARSRAIMSRWGHSMYRLVICAPHRRAVGPECLNDVQHHVVLSYRADVRDLRVNNWRGLTGQYPSQLYLLPFTEVVDEYTEEQLRELISLPLRLSVDQKAQLVSSALEIYWEYRGRYYFLTNNCATESKEFLQGVIPGLDRLKGMTPIGLYKELIKRGLADVTVLRDRAQAVRLGFFVESKRPKLERAMAAIAPYHADAALPLKEFAGKSRAVGRAEAYRAALPRLSAAERRKVAGYFYFLEAYLDLQANRDLVGKILKHYEALVKAGSPDRLPFEQFGSIARLAMASHPVDRLGTGYGVPLPADFKPETAEPRPDPAELERAHARVQEMIRERFPAEVAEVAAVAANKKFFRAEILRD
jgi:hypothetical protein